MPCAELTTLISGLAMIRDQLFPHLLTAYCLLLSLCPLWLKPGAVIDGVSFVDCIFRGVRLVQNRERLFSSPSGRGWVRVPTCRDSGSILFRNVKIKPAEKGRSLNSRPTWPKDFTNNFAADSESQKSRA